MEDVATAQVFKPWELSDEIPRLRYEVSTIPDNVRLIELLYKAAYRDGLGYSLYCPKRQIGKINSETVHNFFQITLNIAFKIIVHTFILFLPIAQPFCIQ